MSNVDFVPNGYLEQRQSTRTNLTYLGLFALVMCVIGATFFVINMRKKAVENELAIINAQLLKANDQIALLEELQIKGKALMKTAAMAAELPETVSKSVLLACITNNLPGGTSLLKFDVSSKQIKKTMPAPTGKEKAAGKKAAAIVVTTVKTSVEISGIAPSDIEVANFIAGLSNSTLFDNVGLVESKEHSADGLTYREFKLKSNVKQDVRLTKENLDAIRSMREEII
jgi:Tfp pilus assembly protein PilN